MDYGLWISDGFGSPKSKISHQIHGLYGFYMDLILISEFHIDLDWIWIMIWFHPPLWLWIITRKIVIVLVVYSIRQ